MANGLIDLQTDLTSLRYSTMPLGSKSPYIVKSIDNPPSSNQVTMEITKRIDDTSRIAQMLVDKPGIKYLLHEAELQQINAGQKIRKAQQGGKTLVGAVLQQIGNTVVSTLKIAGSTLAQIPVNGTGTHFIKGFRTDTYLQPTNGNPASGFARFFGAGGVEGAQYALRGEIVPGTVGGDNQNFGETSNITGKFNPTPSLYDYNAKVNTDNNEVQNTPIPEWASKQFSNGTLASKGKVIPVNKTEIRPVQATNADTGEATTLPGFTTPFQANSQVETTATPGIETKQNLIKGSVPSKDVKSDLDDNGNDSVQNYTTDKTYTGKTAKDVIGNALTGAPIPVSSNNNDNIYPKETTATKDSIGISNQNIEGDITPLDPPVIKPFREEDQNKKAKNSTKDNITNALTGSAIPLSGSGETTATPGIKTSQNLITDSLPNKDVIVDLGDNGNVVSQNYTSKDTYTGKKTEDNINTALANLPISVGDYTDVYISGLIVPSGNEDVTKGTTSIPTPQSLRSLREDLNNTGTGEETTPIISQDNYTRQVQDFRQGSTTQYSFNYNSNNIKKETRVNLGDQGKKKSSIFYTSYSSKDDLAIDTLNALDISKLNARQDATKAAKDFAKLYFHIITPDGFKCIHFRAFIDSIDDSYNADWQGTKYVGRAEDFYTYGGFSRDINISFKIAAATRSELKPLYRKMVYLASTTAPTYGSVGGFMRGTFVRLTVGSYFDAIPGVITSVKYSLIDELPWEIAIEKGVQQLPTGLQCSVSFKPIHDFAPQTGLHHYFTDKFDKSKTFFEEEAYQGYSSANSVAAIVAGVT